MKQVSLAVCLVAIAALPGLFRATAYAQSNFELVTGKAFDDALPKDFYLEGNAIPTQKRNAVEIHTPAGARAVIALLDTSGYSAGIVTKYLGMMITEGDITVCGKKIPAGSYGFGIGNAVKPAAAPEEPGKFSLYNQAGLGIAECSTTQDKNLKQPRPLQVTVGTGGTARLYYGRRFVELK